MQQRARADTGFTLVELLVVMLVIGILASIAVPVFLMQRRSAWASSTKSDLRNAAAAVMTTAAEKNGRFDSVLTAPGAGSSILAAGNLPAGRFNDSPDVSVYVEAADATTFCLVGTHASDPVRYFAFSQGGGGLVDAPYADEAAAAGAC